MVLCAGRDAQTGLEKGPAIQKATAFWRDIVTLGSSRYWGRHRLPPSAGTGSSRRDAFAGTALHAVFATAASRPIIGGNA